MISVDLPGGGGEIEMSRRWFPALAAASIGALGLAAPAAAAPPATVATHPIVYIVSKNGAVVFAPNTVSAKAAGSRTCLSRWSFDVSNTTASTQVLLRNQSRA